MKHFLIILLFLVSNISYTQETNGISLLSKNDSLSYALGVLQGDQLMKQMKHLGADVFIDKVWLIKGVKDVVSGNVMLSDNQVRFVITGFLEKLKNESQLTMPAASKENILQNKSDSLSYAIGCQSVIGIDQGIEKLGFSKYVDENLLVIGMEHYHSNKHIVNEVDAEKLVNSILADISAEIDMGNEEEGKAFLEQNKLRAEVHETASGLQYEILTEGSGVNPTATSKVEVHYTGTLIDGTVFDSSVERGESIVFGLNQVIPGWTEGVQLMKVGAKYKFYIPHELAYGSRAMGKIGAYSTLIFEVELISIK